MLGKTASPIALFVIGGSLVGMSLKAVDLQSVILVRIKIILMPLTIFALLSILPNVSQEMLLCRDIACRTTDADCIWNYGTALWTQ